MMNACQPGSNCQSDSFERYAGNTGSSLERMLERKSMSLHFKEL